MSNFGAMDLSGLANKNQVSQGNAVSAWLVPGDEATLRQYLTLSESTPVLMVITDQSEASGRLRQLITDLNLSRMGTIRWIRAARPPWIKRRLSERRDNAEGYKQICVYKRAQSSGSAIYPARPPKSRAYVRDA